MTFSPKETSISIFFVWGKHNRKQTSNAKFIFKERVSWSPGWVGTIYGSRVALNSCLGPPHSAPSYRQCWGLNPGFLHSRKALHTRKVLKFGARCIPCPKFYNVSSQTFKWGPKCTHLPLKNKSKLSQVYNRLIQPGGPSLPSLWEYQYFLISSAPFCPNTEPRRCNSSVDFSFGVSTATAFHGFGFLPTLHLGFIENLTHETRLLPSSAVIIWFKRITDLKKAKFRFGLNHLVGKVGWYKAVFQEAVPCGRAAFNKY